ncbi:His-Xaa-Ser system radical SAM maturase HxsC [Sphingobium jiangsuense]|nr:His-Xaa-Ser system radical SAM maturase HxsC [Sphingobium jiangsuense]GLS99870.1 His-Xaa-Ser system radical SAM maturase HxsC [Sphingobium jiangsuense]
MITLGSRKIDFAAGQEIDPRAIVRVSTDYHRPLPLRAREAFLVRGDDAPAGFASYLVLPNGRCPDNVAAQRRVHLPPEFEYLDDGDVVRLVPERGEIRTLYRRSSPHNSFLLTERCNNYCLMCSQPPRDVNDGWIVDEILATIPLIDPDTGEIGFTGGEPTLLGGRFFELVQACKSYLPRTALHILTNGRTFSDDAFARTLGSLQHHDLMLGIPIYADLPHVHDYIVQADGAFDETIRGILNLKRHGVRVEVRVVLHKQTVTRLPALAAFLARNLLFVDHVALMGLEMMGFTRANLDALWIDPDDYRSELTEAIGILDRARMRVSLYNAQLCLTDQRIWRFAKRSISDWKQEYMPECEGCIMKGDCGGFFASAKHRYSDRISPIAA